MEEVKAGSSLLFPLFVLFFSFSFFCSALLSKIHLFSFRLKNRDLLIWVILLKKQLQICYYLLLLKLCHLVVNFKVNRTTEKKKIWSGFETVLFDCWSNEFWMVSFGGFSKHFFPLNRVLFISFFLLLLFVLWIHFVFRYFNRVFSHLSIVSSSRTEFVHFPLSILFFEFILFL